jgi:hypothetical protein
MHHLQRAVEHLRGAGDIAFLADRQQLLDIPGLRAKICQHDIASFVAGIDDMRRLRAARWRGAMTVDGDIERHDLPDHGHSFGNCRPCAAVDHIRRQMQQQIDEPRRLFAVQQIAQQFVLLGADALQACDGRKQRIEQCRAHRATR